MIVMYIPEQNKYALPSQILAALLIGDSRCAIAISKTVEKIKVDEDGDLHPVGSRGRVIGNLHNPMVTVKDAYYVKWEKTGMLSLTVGFKVKEIL